MTRPSPAMLDALELINHRNNCCAEWLIPRKTLRALIRRRLVWQCGFYSFALTHAGERALCVADRIAADHDLVTIEVRAADPPRTHGDPGR